MPLLCNFLYGACYGASVGYGSSESGNLYLVLTLKRILPISHQ